MLNFNSILLFSPDPDKLAEFYTGVFGAGPGMSDGGYHGFQVGAAFVTIGPHEAVTGKNAQPERILLNFETDDVRGEFERIRGLGATVVAEPYQPAPEMDGLIATLADPDGNFFQLMTPFEM